MKVYKNTSSAGKKLSEPMNVAYTYLLGEVGWDKPIDLRIAVDPFL
jgi:hypothetical protein